MSVFSEEVGAKLGGMAQDVLVQAGMSGEEAASKAALLARCEMALDERAGEETDGDTVRYFVPGRVEILGKHTDYAGGRSLLCAVERGICIAARARQDRLVRVNALDLGESVEFVLEAELEPARGTWRNYAMTVGRRVARNFSGPLRGAEIAFAGDLPPAAGLSSSSALIIAIFSALRDVNSLEKHPAYRANIHSMEDLAGYMGTIENGQTFGSLSGDMGVGTFGGSQDHTAILCCAPGRLSQYAFCPVRAEGALDWPGQYVLAIGVSGVAAEKTGSAMEQYNSASKRIAAIVELWQRATGRRDRTVAAAVASLTDAAAQLREIIRSAEAGGEAIAELRLGDRLEQFLAESDRIIPQAAAALRAGQIEEAGWLVDQSQKNSAMLLGNQVAETVALQRMAREFGAPAASAFGAGFGGAVWAMVLRKDAKAFLEQWRAGYAAAFPERMAGASFLLTRPGPAAQRV